MPPARSRSACCDSAASERLLQKLPEQERRLLVGERLERERGRVELAAAPAGPPLEELRPRRADHEQRDVGHPVDQLVDEVEQALVRPVQVLEDEHERALLGKGLEEAAPGREGLVPPVAAELCLACETDEREEV